MNGNGVEPLLMGNSKHITIVKFKIYALTHILHKSIIRMFTVSAAHREKPSYGKKKILYKFYLSLFFPVPGAEVWVFPLQKVQHPVGECLCMVHLWNE